MNLLMDEWNKIGRVGHVAVAEPNEIIVFVHEDEHDAYSEIHYPTFDKLRENPVFVRRCVDEFLSDMDSNIVDCPDDQFQFRTSLSAWLRGRLVECPLAPVDVYFPANGMHTFYVDFEDDVDEEKEEVEYQANIQKYSEFCGWALSTLSYIRSTLYDAVRMELGRGHNIPDAYDVANGQDYFFDFSFCYVDTQKVVATNGVLYVVCYENGGKTSFEIPFDSLSEKAVLDIYESMK